MDAYLDIETTGLSPYYDELTVVGICISEGTRHRLTQLVSGAEAARRVRATVNGVKTLSTKNIRTTLQGVEALYTYNGSRFDLPFIRSRLGVDLEQDFQHHDLMYDCWDKNLFGGLKQVERQLGIQRTLTDINGYEAVRLWHRYQATHDLDALHLLLEYNKEDVLNLMPLRAHLANKRRGR